MIPVYNEIKYLKEALLSVLNQSFAEYEVLIIDDGSSSDIVTALDTFSSYDDRIYVHHISHGGVSYARNIGIELSSGTFIAFLDADDIWMPNKLEKQVSLLESQPKVGVVYTNAEFISTEGTLIGKTICEHWNMSPMPSGNILESLLEKSFIVQSTVITRSTCFKEVGKYDENLRRGEDWHMFIRLAKHYEFVFIDEILVHYRRHQGSVSLSSESQLNDVLSVVNVIFSDPDLSAYQNKRKNALVSIYLHEGVWNLKHGKPRHARDFFLSILKEHPNHLFSISGWCLTWLPARLIPIILTWIKYLQIKLLRLRKIFS